MSGDLAGRRALVTGASRGIGRAIAQAFAGEGAHVAIAYGASPAKAEETVASITAADVKVPWVWDVASFAGKKVGATNIPLAYPVHAVNGILISGLMTPIPMIGSLGMTSTAFAEGISLEETAPGLRSFSRPVKTEGSDSLNTFVWWRVDTTNDNVANSDRVVMAVTERLKDEHRDTDGRLYMFDVGEYSPWVKVRAVWRDEARDGWCKFRLFRTCSRRRSFCRFLHQPPMKR